MASNATPKPQTQQLLEAPAKVPDAAAAAGKTALQPWGLLCSATTAGAAGSGNACVKGKKVGQKETNFISAP